MEGSDAQARSKLNPGLYLVATPIGNLEDLSARALRTLASADQVFCEDTRITRRLLGAFGVSRPLESYHDHNAERLRPRILARLGAGAAIALTSDAGTPLISDPGYKLVRETLAAGHPVTAVPGPSAVLAALQVSGLPTDRFLFLGFLPTSRAARKQLLAAAQAVPASLVVFEAARRLADTLLGLAQDLGPREAAVTRELTKRFEEVRRGRLDELARHYLETGPPRGEVVIVIAPGDRQADDDDAIEAALHDALQALTPSAAAATVAATSGKPRRELYRRALALKRNRREPVPEDDGTDPDPDLD